ncbi:glycosyltransferase family protein [Marinobacter bohaiensis]|uniref:hypothetical protein n=1 Tax=Marinobacter bohaiensis TaxID=2201898 RepID=UPI000DAE36D1|nr:hypothetical protein [Marinobacter bohaiensis]
MSFKVIGKAKDLKSGAEIIYCQASPDQYLKIVGNNFGEFTIQRRRESHKAYRRLKADILEGALLPSITLAVKPHLVSDIISVRDDWEALSEKLNKSGTVDILDGLQRTYILSDIKSEESEFKEGQELLLEFWLESDISKLIYRMIVLNSGQKAMSMRHQVELLFMSLKETIESQVKGIELIREKDAKRRTQPSKYSLNNIASSYQSFITASPENDKENMVAQKLIDEDAFDSSEEELNQKFGDFIFYLNKFYELDQICWEVYSSSKLERQRLDLSSENVTEEDIKRDGKLAILEESAGWLGSENTMQSFFSAVAQYINLDRRDRVNRALDSLLEISKVANEDPLGMFSYTKVKSGLNPRKQNVGYATRRLIANGFKEFFREEGALSLNDCWPQAAE